jgi:hypothetical protein
MIIDMADVVVIPGQMFGPWAPLPMYAGDVATLRGAKVYRHSWSQEPPTDFGPQLEGWVRGEVSQRLETIGGRPLVIGKSLGTLAAALAAERSLPAVWLTPLLTVPWAAAALDRATAPFLLVGGTADKRWDGNDLVRSSRSCLLPGGGAVGDESGNGSDGLG